MYLDFSKFRSISKHQLVSYNSPEYSRTLDGSSSSYLFPPCCPTVTLLFSPFPVLDPHVIVLGVHIPLGPPPPHCSSLCLPVWASSRHFPSASGIACRISAVQLSKGKELLCSSCRCCSPKTCLPHDCKHAMCVLLGVESCAGHYFLLAHGKDYPIV